MRHAHPVIGTYRSTGRCRGSGWRPAAVAERWLDPVNSEIGSLPIDALAIALALRACFSGPNLDDT